MQRLVVVSRGVMRDGNAVGVRGCFYGSLGVDRVDHFGELDRIDATRSCFVITRSADGNVLVRATNHLNGSLIAETHGEGGIVLAEHADGAELRYRFGTRDQVQHLTKGLTLESTVQCSNDHDLAEVGGLLTECINIRELQDKKKVSSTCDSHYNSLFSTALRRTREAQRRK